MFGFIKKISSYVKGKIHNYVVGRSLSPSTPSKDWWHSLEHSALAASHFFTTSAINTYGMRTTKKYYYLNHKDIWVILNWHLAELGLVGRYFGEKNEELIVTMCEQTTKKEFRILKSKLDELPPGNRAALIIYDYFHLNDSQANQLIRTIMINAGKQELVDMLDKKQREFRDNNNNSNQ